jgi:transcriptional regulator with XRE-family HTH domain
MDVRLQVGLNFRRLRLSKGLTQEQAADVTGVSQQYISGLERGRRNPTVLTLHELSGPLGAEPVDLLQIVEEAD